MVVAMTKFKVGDIIYTPNGDHYSVSKILAVDFNEMKRNPFLLYHVLLYKIGSIPAESGRHCRLPSIAHACAHFH